ncbi:hypothetical protein OV208_04600 [Corallococcus sp. bb12-1]|uniref:DUF3592 domain-containing protein n=1 Tax=Corallococcus sp. bb12-1 TaxID=2996784 RepID=UPI002270C0B4|nr:DUF3592 domain-containing protein [Corallococcus sp. bb12-1]MCY1040594.1 hypothetical protein [Corallococcus sp. bb12-1]
MSLPLLVILLFGFVVIPLLILKSLLKHRTLTLQVRQRGLHTRGKVLRVRDDFKGNSSRVDYVFSPPEGPEIHDSFHDSRQAAATRTPGSPIDIAYLPEAPRHHLRENVGFERPQVILVTLLFLLFASCGGIGVVGNYLQSARQAETPRP